jgi:hypothetical protein
MDTNIIRLLQTLKDFTPELQELSDEELYNFWRLWMEQWHKGTLKDFVEQQKVLS